MSLSNIPFDHAPKYLLFFGLNAFLMIIDIQILPLFFNLNALMITFLVSIYYWSIYNPRLLPAWFLFLIGMLKDLLSGFPLIGLSALLFIGAHEIVKRQRIFLSGQSFFMIWAGYALISALICFIFWGVLCLYLREFGQYQVFFIEYLIMLFSFPLLLSIMAGIDRLLPFASHDKAPL